MPENNSTKRGRGKRKSVQGEEAGCQEQSVWIGRKILDYFKKSVATALFWPLLRGTFITTFLVIIPILGWFFWLFFVFIGIGAIWGVIWRAAQGKRAESMPESLEERA